MINIRVSFLHPFTAKAIGFEESHLLDSHSIPQIKALKIIQDKKPAWTEYLNGVKNIFNGCLIKERRRFRQLKRKSLIKRVKRKLNIN